MGGMKGPDQYTYSYPSAGLLCLTSSSPFRGVGCIHYEMVTGRPMFPGSTVKEELHLIFRLLGKSSILSASCSVEVVGFYLLSLK